ncbi:RraA family protein [Deinococcus gobiensis]|nr:RraA family protein [Deinococcus gobiensis]
MTLNAEERRDLRQRYLKVDTANVADILDELGHPDLGLSADFWPIRQRLEKMAGWAYTVRGQLTPYPGTGDPRKMEAVAGIGPDELSVWSGGGAEGICFFGELIARGMQYRGSVGALVDGGIRDIEWLDRMDYPVFARYRTPVQSIGRWQVNAWQVPVYLPGATARQVTVRPGDFILADFDGAIVIPAELAADVLVKAEALTEKERLIRADLEAGATLPDVLARYGHV